MARVSPYSSTEPQTEASLLSFPEKLWWIVNNPKRGEIHWNAQGTSIVVPSTRKFVDEILNSPSSALFKTKNFASFVRQLNLYGFRKVTEYPRRTVPSALLLSTRCEFKHAYFRKGRRDLLIQVKRHLYTPKKSEDKQQRKPTPPSKAEKQFDQTAGSTSLTSAWNPTLYTPMPFVPWQASLHMPFTLYAPFCNAYQLAQMQQGPVTGVPNAQGIGLPGHFQQSPANPSVMGYQGFGSCEASVKSVASSTGCVPSHEALPAKGVESPNSLLSPPTTVASSTPNAVVMSNTSLTAANSTTRHNSFLTEYANVAHNSKLNSSAQNTSESLQGTPRALNRESAESFQSGAQSGMLKQNKDGRGIDGQESYAEESFD